MMKLKVHRASWELEELAQKWGVKDTQQRDLRRLVMHGLLRPYAMFNRDLQPVVIMDGGEVVPIGGPVTYSGNLWLVQEMAQPFSNFDCFYGVLRDCETDGPGAAYFALSEPMTLSEALALFVVSDENRIEVERLHGLAEGSAPSGREEKTRDVMLVTMACELYGWEPGSERSTGATELIARAKELGFTLSYPTVRKHLKESWERASPTLAAEAARAAAPVEGIPHQPH